MIPRRVFLSLLAGTPLYGWYHSAIASLLGRSDATVTSLEALAPYLETLIPEDETPGAIALEIPAKMLEKASRDKSYRVLLEGGGFYLENEAWQLGKPSFVALDEAERIEVVERAASSPIGSFPRRFFDLTRYDALSFYYARLETWESLSYPGPPQPVGFPDHEQAPGDV